jgi:hypothetical protein
MEVQEFIRAGMGQLGKIIGDMNRKTFLGSLLSAVGLGVAAKEVKAEIRTAGQGLSGGGRLIGSHDIAMVGPEDYKYDEASVKDHIKNILDNHHAGPTYVLFDEKGREYTYRNGRLTRSSTSGVRVDA